MNPTLQSFIRQNPTLTDDAAALAAWLADATTARPIPLAGLTAMLRVSGLERRLKAIVADPARPQPLRDGLTDFLAQAADPRQVNIDTTDPGIIARTDPLLSALVQGGDMKPDEAAGILLLGGGRRHDPAVVIADVTAARAQNAVDDRAEALRAGLARGGTAAAERVAQYERGEAAEPTADELAALVKGALPS